MPTPSLVRALPLVAGAALVLSGATVATGHSQAPSRRAQGDVQSAGTAHTQSRRQLEARATQLERDPRRHAEAAAIRTRLREGDFQVGDVIVLNVAGVPQFSDTFPVRAGRVLQLPEIPPIPLAGVLRSELQPHIQREIARYVINPTVEAYSLVRVAVAGAVTTPGFYDVRPDAPVTEAVMRAGGLSRDGDATKMSLRRAGRTVIPEPQLRQWVAMGATLDDLNVHAGDELRVGERKRHNWLETTRTLAYVIVMATGLWATGRF